MRLVQPLIVRSLSGAPLDIWNSKVRLVYLDEAGIGNQHEEPYLVIAGVILNADQHWRDVQRYIKAIRRKYLPPDDQDNFIFHAKDIWHGSGYFSRSKWPLAQRMQILRELAGIPNVFHLPVVHQSVDRAVAARWLQARRQHRPRQRFGFMDTGIHIPPEPRPPLPPAAITAFAHMTAWVRCVQRVDLWMNANAHNEVAMLVAENPGKIQRFLKHVHAGYADDEIYEPWAFTTRHIVDTVTFAEKEESILLQIADTCAFVIKRKISGKADVDPYFERLDGQLISSLERGAAWSTV